MVSIVALPRFWRGLFWIEIPLVAITLALWLFQPDVYLHSTIGIAAPGEAERFLLWLYAGTVASLVFGFYAWLLWQPAVHLPTFRAFQGCLAIGDVLLVIASLAFWPASQQHTTLAGQIMMACLWGVMRVVFLMRTNQPSAE